MDGIPRFSQSLSSQGHSSLVNSLLHPGIPGTAGLTHSNGVIRYKFFQPVVKDRTFIISDEDHDELVIRYGLNGGGKIQRSADQFFPFEDMLLSEYEPVDSLGGSGATIAFTLSQVMGRAIDITYVGALDNSPKSNAIRDMFRKARINFVSYNSNPSSAPPNAISLVLVSPNRIRTIITLPGDYGESIAPKKSDGTRDLSVFEEIEFFKDTDFVHFFGTDMQESRLGEAFTRRMRELAKQNGTGWITNFSTNPDFGREQAKFFREVASESDMVMSNAEEFWPIYGDPQDEQLYLKEHRKFVQARKNMSAEEIWHKEKWFHQWARNLTEGALSACQKDLNTRDEQTARHAQRDGREVTVIVTDDVNPAFTLQPTAFHRDLMISQRDHHIQQAYTRKAPPEEYEGSTGCGDTVMAVGVEGYLKRKDPMETLDRGMLLGGRNARQLAACLPDVSEALQRASKHVAASYYYGPLLDLPEEKKVPLAHRVQAKRSLARASRQLEYA